MGSDLVLGATLTGSNPQNLRSMLEDSNNFLTAVEIETSRGLLMAKASRKTAELAKSLSEFDQADFVSLTDNPGGNPHIRPEVLGQYLLLRGRDVVINLSCKAGKCEILDQEYIWIRAYDRLKPFGSETTMLERPVVFRDASLKHTSAWANRFLGRDHQAETNPAEGGSRA